MESIVSVVQEFRCLHTLEMKNVPLQSKSLTHARVYRLAWLGTLQQALTNWTINIHCSLTTSGCQGITDQFLAPPCPLAGLPSCSLPCLSQPVSPTLVISQAPQWKRLSCARELLLMFQPQHISCQQLLSFASWMHFHIWPHNPIQLSHLESESSGSNITAGCCHTIFPVEAAHFHSLLNHFCLSASAHHSYAEGVLQQQCDTAGFSQWWDVSLTPSSSFTGVKVVILTQNAQKESTFLCLCFKSKRKW